MEYFVTGATGFIGRNLVELLLERNGTVYVLVREGSKGRLEELRNRWGVSEDRVVGVVGDLSQPRLGLSDEDVEMLRGDVDHLFHLAAIYDMKADAESQRVANVEGTRHMVELAEAIEAGRVHMVSSIAAAGLYKGTWREDMFEEAERLDNNPYFRTKHESERLVRESSRPWRVYRPGIVVGDSKTGETQKFDGPYYVLRFVAASVDRHMPIANIGRGKTPFNVVPVDFIVDSMVALGRLEEAVGETVHLCDPEPLTSHEMVEVLAQLYAGRKPSYRLPPRGVSGALHVRAVRNLYGGTPSESIRYMNHPVRYDTRRATELLASSGLRCPRFPEYAPAMVEFFRRHEDDPAFHKQ